MMFFKKLQDFIIAQLLNEIKNNVANLKNQNGRLIQDGEEYIFV
jgi:hypothetical protein